MLLHDGELVYVGEPEDAALAYYRKNFAAADADLPAAGEKFVDVNARIVRGALRDGADTLAEGRADRARCRARGGAPAGAAELHLPRPQRQGPDASSS